MSADISEEVCGGWQRAVRRGRTRIQTKREHVWLAEEGKRTPSVLRSGRCSGLDAVKQLFFCVFKNKSGKLRPFSPRQQQSADIPEEVCGGRQRAVRRGHSNARGFRAMFNTASSEQKFYNNNG